MAATVVVPDRDRLEAFTEWMRLHVRMAWSPDEPVRLRAAAWGLVQIIGALREHCGEPRWLPVAQILAAPPEATVTLEMRAGDLADCVWALEQVVARMEEGQ